jgi:hypothetical protein
MNRRNRTDLLWLIPLGIFIVQGLQIALNKEFWMDEIFSYWISGWGGPWKQTGHIIAEGRDGMGPLFYSFGWIWSKSLQAPTEWILEAVGLNPQEGAFRIGTSALPFLAATIWLAIKIQKSHGGIVAAGTLAWLLLGNALMLTKVWEFRGYGLLATGFTFLLGTLIFRDQTSWRKTAVIGNLGAAIAVGSHPLGAVFCGMAIIGWTNAHRAEWKRGLSLCIAPTLMGLIFLPILLKAKGLTEPWTWAQAPEWEMLPWAYLSQEPSIWLLPALMLSIPFIKGIPTSTKESPGGNLTWTFWILATPLLVWTLGQLTSSVFVPRYFLPVWITAVVVGSLKVPPIARIGGWVIIAGVLGQMTIQPWTEREAIQALATDATATMSPTNLAPSPEAEPTPTPKRIYLSDSFMKIIGEQFYQKERASEYIYSQKGARTKDWEARLNAPMVNYLEVQTLSWTETAGETGWNPAWGWDLDQGWRPDWDQADEIVVSKTWILRGATVWEEKAAERGWIPETISDNGVETVRLWKRKQTETRQP